MITERSEPDGSEYLEDVCVQLVQRLVAGSELRLRAGQQRIAVVLVVDQQVIQADAQAALVDPPIARNGEVVRCADPEGEAVECGQLAVAGLEVLEIGAWKQVAVEARGVLGIEAERAVKYPAFPGRMGIADLCRVGPDAPGVRK